MLYFICMEMALRNVTGLKFVTPFLLLLCSSLFFLFFLPEDPTKCFILLSQLKHVSLPLKKWLKCESANTPSLGWIFWQEFFLMLEKAGFLLYMSKNCKTLKKKSVSKLTHLLIVRAICLQTNFFSVPAIIIDLPFWYKCCPYTKSKSAGNLLIPGDNVEESVQVNGLCKSSACLLGWLLGCEIGLVCVMCKWS